MERDAHRAAETALRHGPPPRVWQEGWAAAGAGGGGAAVPGPLRSALEPLVGGSLEGARILADPSAARAAEALGARAWALGRTVVMGEDRFRPDTREGRRLLAHELAHVARQGREGREAVERDGEGEVVEMDPMEVRSGLRGVEESVPGLESLTGVEGAGDGAPGTVEYDEATVARQASPAARPLPFQDGSWDATEILTRLAQRDTLEGTDSDAVRCVQAVALASRVVDGPDAVVAFLGAMAMEGLLSRPAGQRQQAALGVLEHVKTRIQDERATYADLLWAMEALHDLFYTDTEGTPDEEILERLDPTFELGRDAEPMDVWCDGPDEVMAAVGELEPGEQLVVVAHTAIFNVAFDELSEQGIEVEPGRSIVVEVDGRRHRIRRIDTDTRPPHTAIDPLVRDRRKGHQLLVFRDGATGELRLYEPEVTTSGTHLETLEADGSNFGRYFRDHPDLGIYHYIHIIGKLTPDALASSPDAWSAP